MIQNVERLNAELFLNASTLMVSTISNFTTEGWEIFAGANYILRNGMTPWLNNDIKFFSK